MVQLSVKRSLLILLVILVPQFLISCSAYMAANQPDRKDVTVLKVGTQRARVISELGKPIHSEVKNGKTHDIFTFIQGYSTGAKVGRAVLHSAADVATLGLWEVIGTPAESYASGTKISVQVIYDKNDSVETAKALVGEEKLKEDLEPKKVEAGEQNPDQI